MKVLVACEFSGIVRDAFLEAGHEALSCDLRPTESPGPHFQGDVRDMLDDGWDLMIAHPPCRYISRAGARWMFPEGELDEERYKKAMKAREFFMTLLDAPIPQIMIENPTPLKIVDLPEHSQVIQPYQFGHPFSKRTLLWLKNLPQLQPTDTTEDFEPFLPSNTGKGRREGQDWSPGVAHTREDASRTFPGIAKAMADQWGSA